MQTSGESDNVIRSLAADAKRNVFPLSKQVRMRSPKLQCFPDDEHLQSPVGVMLQEIGKPAFLQSIENCSIGSEIDGPAIVGICKAEVPELRSTIEIGNAGRGDLQDQLRKGRQRAEVGCPLLKSAEIFKECFVRI